MVWPIVAAIVKAVVGAGKVAATVGKAAANVIGKAGAAAGKGIAAGAKGAAKGVAKGASAAGKGTAKGVLKGAKGTKNFGKGLYKGAAPEKMGGMSMKAAKGTKATGIGQTGVAGSANPLLGASKGAKAVKGLQGAEKAGHLTGKVFSTMSKMGGGGGGGDPVHTPAKQTSHTPGQPGGLQGPGELSFQEQAPIQLDAPPPQQLEAPKQPAAPVPAATGMGPMTKREAEEQKGTAGKYIENAGDTVKGKLLFSTLRGDKAESEKQFVQDALEKGQEDQIKAGNIDTELPTGSADEKAGITPAGKPGPSKEGRGMFDLKGAQAPTGKGFQQDKPGTPEDFSKGPGKLATTATFLGRFLMGGAPAGVQSALDMIDPVVRHKQKVKMIDARRNNIVERADLIVDKFSKTKDEKGFIKEVKEFVKVPENVDAFTHNLPELYDADDVAEFLYLSADSQYTLKEALMMGGKYGHLATGGSSEQGLQPPGEYGDSVQGPVSQQELENQAYNQGRQLRGAAGTQAGIESTPTQGGADASTDIPIKVAGQGTMTLKKGDADTMELWQIAGMEHPPEKQGGMMDVVWRSTVSQAKALGFDIDSLVEQRILKPGEYMVGNKGDPDKVVVSKARSDRKEAFAAFSKDHPNWSESEKWFQWLQKGDRFKVVNTDDGAILVDKSSGDQKKVNYNKLGKKGRKIKPTVSIKKQKDGFGNEFTVYHAHYYDDKTGELVIMPPYNPEDAVYSKEMADKGTQRIKLFDVPQEEHHKEFMTDDQIQFYGINRYSDDEERRRAGKQPKKRNKSKKDSRPLQGPMTKQASQTSDKVSSWLNKNK